MPLVTDSLRTLAYALVVTVIVVAALVFGREVLLPLALATVLAFILAPVVGGVSRWGIPRGLVAGVVVIVAVGCVAALSAAFSARVLDLAGELSQHKDNIIRKVRVIAGPAGDGVLTRAATSLELIEKEVRKELRTGPADGKPQVVVATDGSGNAAPAMTQIGHTLSALAQTGLTILLTIFLLIQYDDLRDRIIRIAGTDNMSVTSAALSEAGARLSHLFTMQALLNAGFGAFVAVALSFIGVPSPVMWGVATALLRFVPYVGSILAAIPPTLLAASVDPGWSMMAATLAVFVIGEPFVGHVLEPLLLGRSVGISPLALVLSASVWTLLWGPAGLILAAPLTTLIVVLGQYVPRLEFVSVLLSDQPALSADEEFYHRLLAGDATSALAHIETIDAKYPLVAAGDDVVLPALGMAARDYRLARIDRDQATRVGDSLSEVLDMVTETAGPGADEAVAGKAAAPGAVLVVAARGMIDELAAKYVKQALQPLTLLPVVAIEKASGLTALATARSALGGTSPVAIVLVGVGGLDQAYMKLISARAARDFPHARLLTHTRATSNLSTAPHVTGGDGTPATLRRIAETVQALAPATARDQAAGGADALAAAV